MEIAPDSVIYCDIPYIGTAGYNGSGFDHSKFYEWAKAQEQPIFISEYTMPADDFVCVKSYRLHRKFSAQGAQDITEKVFVPRVQIERGIVKPTPLWDKDWR